MVVAQAAWREAQAPPQNFHLQARLHTTGSAQQPNPCELLGCAQGCTACAEVTYTAHRLLHPPHQPRSWTPWLRLQKEQGTTTGSVSAFAGGSGVLLGEEQMDDLGHTCTHGTRRLLLTAGVVCVLKRSDSTPRPFGWAFCGAQGTQRVLTGGFCALCVVCGI